MLCLYTSGKIVSTSQLASAPTHFLRNIHQVVVASDHEVHHIGPANMILYDEPAMHKGNGFGRRECGGKMQLLSAPSDNRKYECAFRSGECDGRGQGERTESKVKVKVEVKAKVKADVKVRVKDRGKGRGKGKGKGKGKVTVYTGINSENVLEEYFFS